MKLNATGALLVQRFLASANGASPSRRCIAAVHSMLVEGQYSSAFQIPQCVSDYKTVAPLIAGATPEEIGELLSGDFGLCLTPKVFRAVFDAAYRAKPSLTALWKLGLGVYHRNLVNPKSFVAPTGMVDALLASEDSDHRVIGVKVMAFSTKSVPARVSTVVQFLKSKAENDRYMALWLLNHDLTASRLRQHHRVALCRALRHSQRTSRDKYMRDSAKRLLTIIDADE